MKIKKNFESNEFKLFEIFDSLYQISFDKKFVIVYEQNLRKIKMEFYNYCFIEINVEAIDILKKINLDSGLYKLNKSNDNEIEIEKIEKNQDYLDFLQYIWRHVDPELQYQRGTSFYLKRIEHLTRFGFNYDRLFGAIYDFLYHVKIDHFIDIFKLYHVLRILKTNEVDKIDISVSKNGFIFELLGDDYRKIAFLYFWTMPWEC